jgi:transcriptional regulator with XRE-family HTH domain
MGEAKKMPMSRRQILILENMRAKKNMSQEEFAEKIGLSRMSYVRRVKGEVDFYLTDIRNIHEFLGMSDREFMSVFIKK